MRIKHRLAIACTFALALSGCAFGVAPSPPPAPTTGIPWSVLTNPGGDRCRNYRNYHTDCRRRRHDGTSDTAQGGGKDQGSDRSDAPAQQSSTG